MAKANLDRILSKAEIVIVADGYYICVACAELVLTGDRALRTTGMHGANYRHACEFCLREYAHNVAVGYDNG